MISEIHEDRVILLSGEDKIEIKLRDDKGIKTSMPKTLARQNIIQNKSKRPASTRRTPVRRRVVQ